MVDKERDYLDCMTANGVQEGTARLLYRFLQDCCVAETGNTNLTKENNERLDNDRRQR